MRHAIEPEWLEWAASKGFLNSLLDPHSQVGEAGQQVAQWVAQSFVSQHTELLLALIEQHGGRPNPVLWNAIGWALCYSKERPTAQALSKLTAFLLSTKTADCAREWLSQLLVNRRLPEDMAPAVLLLDHLTSPRLRLRPAFGFEVMPPDGQKQVGAEVVSDADDHWLREAWTETLLPHIGDLWRAVVPIVTGNLSAAHLLLRAFGSAEARFDPESFGRSAIEAHAQDTVRDALDVLVDMARDTIEWLGTHEPDRARELIESWCSAGIPLLTRLAVHGLGNLSSMPADEKLQWVIGKDWLDDIRLHHELFRLLAAAYPNASEDMRRRILGAVAKEPRVSEAKRLSQETVDYHRYNTLVWLHGAAPSCKLTTEALNELRKARPDFSPREHPDFLHWTSVSWGHESPVSRDELLRKDPETEVEWFLKYEGVGFHGPDREGFLGVIAAAATADFEWSWRLTSVLEKAGQLGSDVMDRIVFGWSQASLSDDQLRAALEYLTPRIGSLNRYWSLGELLSAHGKARAGSTPLSCIEAAEAFAEALYHECASRDDDRERTSGCSWLDASLNEPGGKVAHFWMEALETRFRADREAWSGLPSYYRRVFGEATLGHSRTDDMVCVVLGHCLHFLYCIDREWTREVLLPLLNWSRDARRAEVVWCGYLPFPRWDEAFLAELLPLLRASFAQLSGPLLPERKGMCSLLASIAMHSPRNPLDAGDGWLGSFIAQADCEWRQTWAGMVLRELDHLPPQAIVPLWDRWLCTYWSNRLQGLPARLSPAEAAVMVEWAIPLEPVLAAAVAHVCRMPLKPLSDSRIFHTIRQAEIAKREPLAVSSLLRSLLDAVEPPFWSCDDAEAIVVNLLGTSAPREALLVICDSLARIGCGRAGALRERLSATPNT